MALSVVEISALFLSCPLSLVMSLALCLALPPSLSRCLSLSGGNTNLFWSCRSCICLALPLSLVLSLFVSLSPPPPLSHHVSLSLSVRLSLCLGLCLEEAGSRRKERLAGNGLNQQDERYVHCLNCRTGFFQCRRVVCSMKIAQIGD